MRLPFVYELFPVRDSDANGRKIGAAILGLATVARFPECEEDLNKTGFICTICVQFDEASSYRDILVIVIERNYHSPVSVSFVRYVAILFALEG
jgi:hypothetical protein